MQLKINDKTYNFNFGVRFVAALDKAYGGAINGVNFGMGLTALVPQLAQFDTAGLAKVLYTAGYVNSPRPTINQIYDYIDDPKTNLDKVFEMVQNELETSNATKGNVKMLVDINKKAEKKTDK